MKYMTILTIFFSVMISTANSELTPTDLENIREIVKESVGESEKRTREYVDIKFDSLEKSIDERFNGVNERFNSVNERFNGVNERFNSVDKRMTHQANMTYGLMALVAVAIGFPAWRSQKDRTLEKRIEALTQEIETLKNQRIQPL